MSEYLTIDEMRSRYPDEWLLVENPQMSERKKLLSGTVRFHGKDRLEVLAQPAEGKPTVWALIYTGNFPKNAAFLLLSNSSTPASR